MSADWISAAVAAALTVMILSYLAGDNPFFRTAVHVFVGVAAGYVGAVAWWQVLLPKLILPLVAGSAEDQAMLAVPLLLSGLLLMKAWPPLSKLGSPGLGLLVGVASAAAVGGAVQGTLLPQLSSTVTGFSAGGQISIDRLWTGGLVLLGLATSLVYFQFSAVARKDGTVRPVRVIAWIAFVGSMFLAVTLGVLFAGVYSAALTALIERLHFLAGLVGLA